MNLLQYVNTKMGTDSVPRFSRGNTLPLTALPFSMVSFCPQTEIIKERYQWFFDPNKP
jgi:putative alpha-1,2-mannosidase